jgi:hypothetical protein
MNLKALRPIVRFILRHIYGVRVRAKPSPTGKQIRQANLARQAKQTPSAYTLARKELWAFFDFNHDLVLLESELEDIIDAVDRYRAAVAGDKP